MSEQLYAALERIFHEPHRLAIMSALCAAEEKGLTFNELKDECGLTDGNLSRHLKTLTDAGAVSVKKSFVNSRPRTTVYLCEEGRESFIQYLKALEEVLKLAAEAAASHEQANAFSVSLHEKART